MVILFIYPSIQNDTLRESDSVLTSAPPTSNHTSTSDNILGVWQVKVSYPLSDG
jgi:hypothetical protein